MCGQAAGYSITRVIQKREYQKQDKGILKAATSHAEA